ncbi:MAG: lipopolysaccharide kinase InaA family protein [Deltaproteobacteria bacterium]
MFKGIPIPASFSLIRKENVFLLLKDGYKDSLLQEGIEDVEAFLQRKHPVSRHLMGRTLHPCVPIKEGEWMVVRRYSHGGLFRGVTRDLYLFGSRSFRETALTEEIRSAGIPTVQTVGAIHHQVFPFFYRACLLSLEIPSGKDLTQYLREVGPHPAGQTLSLKRKTIRSAGLLLRQFHRSGFFHADLQLKNFLVSGDTLFLLDFDRSYRKKQLSNAEKMKNLLRLNRSVEKWNRRGLTITRGDRWRFLLAYGGDDENIRETMRRALRGYSLPFFFHRVGWALKKVFS